MVMVISVMLAANNPIDHRKSFINQSMMKLIYAGACMLVIEPGLF